jgi:hypothetical protein
MNRIQPWQFGVMAVAMWACLVSMAGADDLPDTVNDSLPTRPGPADQPTSVRAWIFMVDLDEINSAEQSITANVYYRLQWHDPRLIDKQGRYRTYPLDAVWNPSVIIVNQQRGWKTLPEIVQVSPDGLVTYSQRYYGKLSTPLALRDFPFDTHTFEFRLAAVGSSPDDVRFYTDPQRTGLGRADKLSIPDWECTKWTAFAKPYMPVEGERVVASYVYEFEADRMVGYYVVKVFLPLLLIVLMSWAVFWIDPSLVSAQISVSITSMLTLIAYQFVLADLLPKISYITRMDIFLLGSTALIYAALVEVIITSHMATHNKLAGACTMDAWSRVIFPVLFLGVILAAFVF